MNFDTYYKSLNVVHTQSKTVANEYFDRKSSILFLIFKDLLAMQTVKVSFKLLVLA